MDHYGTEYSIYYPKSDAFCASDASNFRGTLPNLPYSGSPSGYSSGQVIETGGFQMFGPTRHSAHSASATQYSAEPLSYGRHSWNSDTVGPLDFSENGSKYPHGSHPSDYPGVAGHWQETRALPHTGYSGDSPHFSSRPASQFSGGRGYRFGSRGGFRRGGLTPFGDRAPFVRRATPQLFCELCKIVCAGPKALAEHKSGLRHKKKEEAVEQLQKSQEEDSQPPKPVSLKSAEFHCELCDIKCTGTVAYSAHMNGKAHQRVLRLHQELGKPIPENKVPPTISKVKEVVETTAVAGDTGSAANSSKTVPPASSNGSMIHAASEPKPSGDTNVDKPTDSRASVGLEYIKPTTVPGSQAVQFECSLCDCNFTNELAKECHVKGRRHRMQYKRKVDPSYVVPAKGRRPKTAGGRGERSGEMSGIPPIPDQNSLSWTAYTNQTDRSPFFNVQPFGRSSYRNSGPGAYSFPTSQPPNLALITRYISAKHSSIVPTERDAQAMKTAVYVCEHALKKISDDLLETTHKTATSDGSSGAGDQVNSTATNGNVDKPDASATDEDRLLRGVIRVGALGKSLLLRGDHVGHLALVCAEWPTSEVVKFVHAELNTTLTSVDPKNTYNMSCDPETGTITVLVSKSESEAGNTGNESKESFPVVTVQIQLTSSVVCDVADTESYSLMNTDSEWSNSVASGAVKADGSDKSQHSALRTAPEQPSTKKSASHGRLMFAQGERISKGHCLDALDAIDQAKCFQSALLKPPLGIVARVLVDFMRSNEIWLQLDQFAVLAFLDRLLLMDLQMARPTNSTRQPRPAFAHPSMPPFGPPFRNRMQLPLAPIGPATLFIRFFEAISSGILLELQVDSESIPDSPTESGDIAVDKPVKFFAFNSFATVPIATREKITLFAQRCLRQITFRQLHKVLGMEPLASHYTHLKSTHKEQSANADRDIAETGDEDVSGSVKRRRTEDDDDANEKDVQVEPETASGNLEKTLVPSNDPVTAVPSTPDSANLSPSSRSRSTPKRGRRGR